MTDHAWRHALGVMHALVWERGELVGHAAVVQRSLVHAGRALRAGYVEAVAVKADRRGQGHGATMMIELERIIRHAYDLGALGASEMGRNAARSIRRPDVRLARRRRLVTPSH
jgi:aminoglycoside 2'-N-acetyltransferase I